MAKKRGGPRGVRGWTARNLGAAACRTSNKIILTTGLNYARDTNNNICPARIPAINIEGISDSPPLTIREPSSGYPLHDTPRRDSYTAMWSRGPRSYRGGPCEKGPDLAAVILRSRRRRLSSRLTVATITWEYRRDQQVILFISTRYARSGAHPR